MAYPVYSRENNERSYWSAINGYIKAFNTPHYTTIGLFPELQELISPERNFIRKNIVDGPYRDVAEYLDIQFRLLREDFLNPIREDVRDYLMKVQRSYSNIHVFENVKFIGTTFNQNILCYKLEFDKKNLKNVLHNKKRLISGTLLIFSNNEFKSICHGVVADCSGLASCGTLLVSFESRKPNIGTSYKLIECLVFFEPYYRVLKVLQILSQNYLSMSKYIINVETSVSSPKLTSSYYDLNDGYEQICTYIKHLNICDTLNNSQKIAFEAAHNQEFTIIQGPPGTGKTYLGLEITKSLLRKRRHCGPFLIVCCTNHALDQFLEGLVDFTDRLIRFGSQSKSQKLKSYNLYNKRHELRYILSKNKSWEERKCYKKKLIEIEFEINRRNTFNNEYFNGVPIYYYQRDEQNMIESLNTQRYIYRQFKEQDDKITVEVLKRMAIIGMTTTCAARMHGILEKVGCQTVIVEEAAEVLEAHILPLLTTRCRHVILLGDHKQLQPSTSDYSMNKDFNLGISLFERMINNGIMCQTLNVQHRMRPEISALICPSIYPDLQNHRCVNYPSIVGISRSVYFIDHSNLENNYGETGKCNKFEAEFLVKLAEYLINVGYSSENITILSPYLGQVDTIKKQANTNSLSNLKVFTVDNFQGEENDIILLSLVRNNRKNQVGFLSTENRICVALSRAKKGLYIMGNMNMLAKSSKVWKSIKDQLKSQNAIGPSLPLQCIHGYIPIFIQTPTDFQNVNNIGCGELCNQCQRTCHFNAIYPGCYKRPAPTLRPICNERRYKDNDFTYQDGFFIPFSKTLECGHKSKNKLSEPSSVCEMSKNQRTCWIF